MPAGGMPLAMPLRTQRCALQAECPLSIGGAPIARNTLVIEAGLDFALSPTATLGISYGGQLSAGVTE